MNKILITCIILSIFHFSCSSSHFTQEKLDGEKKFQNKTHRNIEPFTTILLNNESFSMAGPEYSMHKSDAMGVRRKEGFKRLGKFNHHLKIDNERYFDVHKSPQMNPQHTAIALSKKDVDHKSEAFSKQHHDKVVKYLKNARSLKKKIRKRHFEKPMKYYSRMSDLKRNFGSTYRYVLTEATKIPTKRDEVKVFQVKTRSFGGKSSTSNSKEVFENLNVNPWENAHHLSTKENSVNVRSYVAISSSLAPTWTYPSKSKQDKTQIFPQNIRNFESLMLPQNVIMSSYSPDIRSTTTWLTTIVPSVQARTFHQADIIERNLAAVSGAKNGKNEKDNSSGDGSEFDDVVVTFDGTCDQAVNQTCFIQREVGDVLTLAIKIQSSRKPSSFQIRWMKLYHKLDSDKGKPLELEPGKLPWNVVSGSEGRQLRLNPLTNSDIDPNCFIAQVFSVSKRHGNALFSLLKKMVFRIDIPIIDMGKLYAGEELGINIENFISLPERGNLLFQWNIETKPQEYESLPSNVKVSNSGRSVVLKELKKGRLGVLNCVVYSSNRYAVAKRRFNILKIVENLKRRSTEMSLAEDYLSHDLQRSRRCRHLIRRSQEEVKQRLIDGNKPKSRKKRFRRMESTGSQASKIDCESLRRKMYSRWVRSLLRDITTEDPRLMPLEKLFELSEEGDGTLDDVIPHEVHYVSPEVKLISGTSAERSVDRPISTNCTSHLDCGENAVCVFPESQKNITVLSGNCYCRPEFYRDDTTCRKIPSSNHREKRLKRNARNDFAVPQDLFYENSREIVKSTPETLEEDEDAPEPPKVLAFEEEESFLLTDCIDDKDCSMHANCIQPTNGHPYCKCRPGYRGNGIFCWEMMDYVPPGEQFLTDTELDNLDESPLQPERLLESLQSKTIEEPQVYEEEV